MQGPLPFIHPPTTTPNCGAVKNRIPLRLCLYFLVLMTLQVSINVVVWIRTRYHPHPHPPGSDHMITKEEQASLMRAIAQVQQEITEITHSQSMANVAPLFPPHHHKKKDLFFPFTIRDAKRLSPVQIPPSFHIFDYVDPNTQNQRASNAQQLWLDGYFVHNASCSRYSVLCYKQKIVQVLDFLLNQTQAEYFFYMEADNELCVSMEYIRELAFKHRRYFIGTGIGFSGWIMQRQFVKDFLKAYRPAHIQNNESPDPIGARLLMQKKAWTVTRQYLVSHTIQTGFGAPSLTVGKVDKKTGKVTEIKHLPRCLEPKRTKWLETKTSTEDMHGWDFFDVDDCPPDAELYPCRPDQYINVTFGVEDMFKPTPSPKDQTTAKNDKLTPAEGRKPPEANELLALVEKIMKKKRDAQAAHLAVDSPKA